VVSNLELATGKVSPAEVRFVLRDQESDPLDVEILFAEGSTDPRPVQLVADPDRQIDASLSQLSTSPGEGTQHVKLWGFASQVGNGFREDLTLLVKAGGSTEDVLVDVGNDPPRIEVDLSGVPQEEVAGIAQVSFTVLDSSDDSVSIDVQYAIVDGLDLVGGETPAPEDFVKATPAENESLEDLPVSRSGTSLNFFWTVEADLGDSEHDVLLRLQAVDHDEAGKLLREGDPVLTPKFSIDNDAEPVVFLHAASFVTSPDKRRGIPVYFTVQDEEADDVNLVFQWRRPGQSFNDPGLDLTTKTVDEIAAILEDPELHRSMQVCTEIPRSYEGRVVPLSPAADPLGDSIRLAELAGPAAGILGSGGVVGRNLQILRASRRPFDVTAEWTASPLSSPRGAIPLGRGLTALVLDRPAPQSWRLREINLATGSVVRSLIEAGVGEPDVLGCEPGGTAVLIGTHDPTGVWSLRRLDLQTAQESLLWSADGSTENGPIRGLAGLTPSSALVTVANSLILVRYDASVVSATALIEPDASTGNPGLHTPWGVVVDKDLPNRTYIAENTYPGASVEGRVVQVDLDGYRITQIRPLVDGSTFCRPETLAMSPDGQSLYVVTVEPTSGSRMLRGIDIGREGSAFVLVDSILGRAGSVQPGEHNLLLVTQTDSNKLLAGGGVEQVCGMQSYDATTRLAKVAQPFTPPIALGSPPRRWRILDWTNPAPATPEGDTDFFVWDSQDVLLQNSEESVVLRVTPFQSEVGTASDTEVPRTVSSSQWSFIADLALQGPSLVDSRAIATADLDGDGDLDLVSANRGSNNLAVYYQEEPGSFNSTPMIITDSSVTTPFSIAATDLDGDGDIDLASANQFSNNLTLFFQEPAGVFDGSVKVLSDSSMIKPSSVEVADLDGDGDVDLVSANSLSDNLTVFFQLSPGCYGPAMVLTGPEMNSTNAVRAADVNNDGKLDLVSTSFIDNSVSVFLQTSSGVFDFETALGDPRIDGPNAVLVADLNRDGTTDLVTSNLTSGNLSIFFQDLAGGFANQPVIVLPPGLSSVGRPIFAADLDNDEDFDLVFRGTNNTGTYLAICLQDESGSFTSPPLLLGQGTGLTPSAVADIDGDGLLDLAAVDLSGALHLFLQDPLVPYGPPVQVKDPSIATVWSLEATDLDGDADLDLLVPGGGKLVVLFQDVTGSFSESPLVLDDPSLSPFSVRAADLNGDGDVDLFCANPSTHSLAIFHREGGSFVGPVVIRDETMVSPFSVVAADLNNDGDLDLVSANESSNNLTIFYQTMGSFEGSTICLSDGQMDGPLSVKASDLDGDGDLDLLCANFRSNNLSLFYQDNGSFADALTLVPSIGVFRQVLTVDIDGDGDLDLLSFGNAKNAGLAVYFQDAGGSYSDPPLVIADVFFGMAVADMDGDRDLDLICVKASDDHTLSVFFQDAPGVFRVPALEIANPRQILSVSAADLDGDSIIDLVAGGSGGVSFFYGDH
jgi:hypothetical protein